MSLNDPRLRGGASRRSGPYPLGQFPDAVLRSIGKQIIHRLALGHSDITGDDFHSIQRHLDYDTAAAIGATWLVKYIIPK